MQDKVFDIIDDIEKEDEIIRLKKIIKEIRSDDKALSLIKSFNNAKMLYDKYNVKEDFIEAKKSLMDNKLIKEYLSIQNDINMLILHINDRINKITK
ncbi:MAG: YlbF family regulator [Tenericutes bacterium]|nr:YlbF family regulator [Mycoplasmatota bacterium]